MLVVILVCFLERHVRKGVFFLDGKRPTWWKGSEKKRMVMRRWFWKRTFLHDMFPCINYHTWRLENLLQVLISNSGVHHAGTTTCASCRNRIKKCGLLAFHGKADFARTSSREELHKPRVFSLALLSGTWPTLYQLTHPYYTLDWHPLQFTNFHRQQWKTKRPGAPEVTPTDLR